MRQPIKVEILSNEIAPYRVPLYNRLSSEEGLDIEVLFCSKRIRERQWEIRTDRHFKNVILPGFNLRLRKSNYAQEIRTIHVNPTLLLHLFRRSPDVVIAVEFSIPAVTAFTYCKLLGKRYISWSEGTLYTERHNSRAQQALRHLIIPRADTCIAVSSGAKEKYVALGAHPDRVFIGIQTVDVDAMAQKCQALREAKRTYREEQNISGKIILFTGHLNERKGVIHLLKSLAFLRAQIPDVYLVLAGEGPEREKLIDFCRVNGLIDAVTFAGFIPQDALPSFYAAADVFVLPSLEDTFGVVVSEAMASGLPVVCSMYAGAAQDLIVEGVNGYRVDPVNHRQLAQRLFDILSNPAVAKEMVRASLKIIAMHDIEACAQGYLQAIKVAVSSDQAH
jgi:glycosyltransferase involved in cell wall biosynthesis